MEEDILHTCFDGSLPQETTLPTIFFVQSNLIDHKLKDSLPAGGFFSSL